MMKYRLIFTFIIFSSLFNAQYFPFKNENKFDTVEYKRIRDSLIAYPQKNSSQTISENGILYDSKYGTNIMIQYSKNGCGLLQITKGSHWILYHYFDNLQLRFKKENISRHHATGIWKEYNERGKLVKAEDMDVIYDDRPEYIDKKIKLVSVREIAKKLNSVFQKKMFDDTTFFDLRTFIDDETNKWVYRIVFTDETQKNNLQFFDYDAHNGNFIKKELFTVPEGFQWH